MPVDVAEPVTRASGKKKVGRPRTKPLPTDWFGRDKKVGGRLHISNYGTNEIDVLSLAKASGITTDTELTKFMLRPEVIQTIASLHETAMRFSKKANQNPEDRTVVTRYYRRGEVPEFAKRIPIIRCEESPGEVRWGIRAHLVVGLCNLLDRTQIGVEGRPIMVSFREKRQDLNDITSQAIRDAENEVFVGRGTLAKDLLVIRAMLQANMERGMMEMMSTNRDLEGKLIAEKALRAEQISQKDLEIEALRVANKRTSDAEKAELAYIAANIGKIIDLNDEYHAGVRAIESDYLSHIVRMTWRLALAQSRTKPDIVSRSPERILVDDTTDLRRELEDAKLEIARLKDDVRAKAIPKPKVHKKPKDPDIHLATETDMKSSVKAYLSSRSEGFGTPISRTSTVASRARKATGVPEPSPISMVERKLAEERELEEARKLRTLSRLREEDLCYAEQGSEQLIDVIDALSSLLTKVNLTIEDVSTRKTDILNRMRSLALHGRSITAIIRERPYLLPLARRMNHERRPLVKLNSIRALVNVAETNLKTLREIENITLDSVGGTVDVMSLEEAAESAVPVTDEHVLVLAAPDSTSRTSRSPGNGEVLTKANLTKHTTIYGREDTY